MARDFDLFGQPLPRNLGQPGRNEHVATAENVNRVRVLLAAEWTRCEIAAELGISVPTLRKHYFRELTRGREIALREVRGKVMLALDAQVDRGNVGAMKTMLTIIEKAGLRHDPAPAREPRQGKKELRKIEAREPAGEWAQTLAESLPN